MENVCQREENLLYFRDQVACSRQNHEMTRQTNHRDWKNGNTNSLPGAKSAEQSDENISRKECFKKGKEKLWYRWRAKSVLLKSILTGKCRDSWVESVITKVEGCTKSVQNANGIKASKKNCFRNLFRIYLLIYWRLWSPCFPLYFAKGKQLLSLIDIKFMIIQLSCNPCMHWV